MASKIGKALGYSMDLGETPREKKLGINDGNLPKVDAYPAEMDSDSDAGEDANGPDSSMEDGPESMKDEPKADAEVMAMRLFEKAKSPEAKVDALKAFLEACGAIGGSY
jgi:hypothetical protein